mmetsp:Transcript_66643/g.152595  ORF Transcript_66643/g.152595 Transcript_66643/m.152595 type:complete len:508 (-) Transcript_66643:97-1620(-)
MGGGSSASRQSAVHVAAPVSPGPRKKVAQVPAPALLALDTAVLELAPDSASSYVFHVECNVQCDVDVTLIVGATAGSGSAFVGWDPVDGLCRHSRSLRAARGMRQRVVFGDPQERLDFSQRSDLCPFWEESTPAARRIRWPVAVLVEPSAVKSTGPVDGSCCSFFSCRPDSMTLVCGKQIFAYGARGFTSILAVEHRVVDSKQRRWMGSMLSTNLQHSASSTACSVCRRGDKVAALLPCGHLCACEACSTKLVQSGLECPLCSLPVESSMNIQLQQAPEMGLQQAVPCQAGDDVVTVPHSLDSTPSCALAPAVQKPFVNSAAGVPKDLPVRALRRLMKERQMLMDSAIELRQSGIVFLWDDEQPQIWGLRMLCSAIDPASRLGTQLREKDIRSIDFEVFFPDDYPVRPPKVRVIRPEFQDSSFWVLTKGALCLEILTLQGWSPAVASEQLARHIIAMMTAATHGEIVRDLPGTSFFTGAGRDDSWAAMATVEQLHKGWGTSRPNLSS